MGGRGSTSGISTAIPLQSAVTYSMLSPKDEQEVVQNLSQQYDINTKNAIRQYIREDQQANGFTMSQNMNHKMEDGTQLNANESYVKSRLEAAMHPLGKDAILIRAAHKDFLEALGVHNYQNMTPAQLDTAVKGTTYSEKKFVSAAMDPQKNPFISGYASGGREVYINIKTPASTKCVLGNTKQSEVILAPGTTFKATGAHFDGTYATPRLGGRLPRVVIDVEVVKKS